MKKYKAYILDDEPLAIISLKKRLESHPDIETVGEATRMNKAMEEVTALCPDILFLDIQLAEGSGFDFLNNIRFSGRVVFVTAYDKYAFRAFEVNALDYLLKPVSQERMDYTIEKLKSSGFNYHKSTTDSIEYKYSDRIFFTERDQIRFIPLESIIKISAARDYSFIETNDGKKNIIMRSMYEWENRLPKDHFIRIHRSSIININYIERIVRNSTSTARIYLTDTKEPVSLSRSYYKNLKETYL